VRVSDIWKVVKKEFLTGVTMGSAMALFAVTRALVMQTDPQLGLTVGFTMIGAVCTATTLGAILPILFKKLGFDPAVMSNPLITSIMDSVTLILYFTLARVIYRL